MSSILKVDQLQDSGGNAIITSNGSGTITVNSQPFKNGITEADQWRLTTNIVGGGSGDINANLERVDDATFAKIGTGMTESSGIFTFPATGIWSIEAFCSFIDVGGDTSCEVATQVTTDNSTYNNAASAIFGENDADTNRGVTCSKFIFDVTNTSTHKCLFRQVSFAGGTSLNGDSTLNRTYFIFTRLGDT